MAALTAGVIPALLAASGGELRTIFFRDLIVEVPIGIHPHEQGRTQRVAINIELLLAPQRADHGDDIGKVLDYDHVRDSIMAIVAARHVNLQETLVEAVVDTCLGLDGVRAVRASTEKLDVYADCAGVGYEVVRIKDAPPGAA